jgi:hypothetical protein
MSDLRALVRGRPTYPLVLSARVVGFPDPYTLCSPRLGFPFVLTTMAVVLLGNSYVQDFGFQVYVSDDNDTAQGYQATGDPVIRAPSFLPFTQAAICGSAWTRGHTFHPYHVEPRPGRYLKWVVRNQGLLRFQQLYAELVILD